MHENLDVIWWHTIQNQISSLKHDVKSVLKILLKNCMLLFLVVRSWFDGF